MSTHLNIYRLSFCSNKILISSDKKKKKKKKKITFGETLRQSLCNEFGDTCTIAEKVEPAECLEHNPTVYNATLVNNLIPIL